MLYVKDKYKDAKDFLHATSEELSIDDIINPIIKDYVSITQPYVGKSRILENILDMLFSNLTSWGDSESLDEENDAEEDGPEDKVEAIVDKEFKEDDTLVIQRTASGESSQQPIQSF